MKISPKMDFGASSLKSAVNWPPHTLFGAVCEVFFAGVKVSLIVMPRKLYLSAQKACA